QVNDRRITALVPLDDTTAIREEARDILTQLAIALAFPIVHAGFEIAILPMAPVALIGLLAPPRALPGQTAYDAADEVSTDNGRYQQRE
ncbi:hypothetical protein OFO30_33660, partial [Escherichia coli]|nr:hypothetical protein [Escherichia coli]